MDMKVITKPKKWEEVFNRDILADLIRARVRESIKVIVAEELEEALGAGRHERSEARRGYRHGSESREFTVGMGKVSLVVPRARLFGESGTSREWKSRIVPRYERRSAGVDAAILGVYLAGANTRRIKGALSPLLKDAPLSKSAVSRIVGRLKEVFADWRKRSLAEEDLVYLYLDALGLKVRLAKKIVRVPVHAVLGIKRTGEKVLVDLHLLSQEATASWQVVVEDLVGRGLKNPELCVIDGNPGLRRALADTWPKVPVQRCTVHKLNNLLIHSPKHIREEVKEDYRQIVYAEDGAKATEAYQKFIEKWKKICPGIVTSLKEAGDELLTFYRFPEAQWKSLRTTNLIEAVNKEFRRRVKTQGAFPDEDAALVLLYALFASGQIKLRRIDGFRTIAQLRRAA
jgi:transposase-like protein